MEQMMSRMDSKLDKISERMKALEELIKETKAAQHGSDSKTQSEEGDDSDESDSNN